MARKSDAFIAVGAVGLRPRVSSAQDFTLASWSRASARPRSARACTAATAAWLYVAAGATGFRILHKYVGRTEDHLHAQAQARASALEIREIRAKQPK